MSPLMVCIYLSKKTAFKIRLHDCSRRTKSLHETSLLYVKCEHEDNFKVCFRVVYNSFEGSALLLHVIIRGGVYFNFVINQVFRRILFLYFSQACNDKDMSRMEYVTCLMSL